MRARDPTRHFDGEVALDWVETVDGSVPTPLDDSAPILIIFHGVSGGSQEVRAGGVSRAAG